MVTYVLPSMKSIDGLEAYSNSGIWENLISKVLNTICHSME